MTTIDTSLPQATEKQIDLITKLAAERDLSLEWEKGMPDDGPHWRSTAAAAALNVLRDVWVPGYGVPRAAASEVIEHLLAAPKKDTASAVEAPEGMHRLDGVIYKVQRAVHGSGNLYAKALVEDGAGGWMFEYAPGVVRNLSEATKMSLEEAKQFGALYGTCCVCGRTLTSEASIEAGIGPVCSGKFPQ